MPLEGCCPCETSQCYLHPGIVQEEGWRPSQLWKASLSKLFKRMVFLSLPIFVLEFFLQLSSMIVFSVTTAGWRPWWLLKRRDGLLGQAKGCYFVHVLCSFLHCVWLIFVHWVKLTRFTIRAPSLLKLIILVYLLYMYLRKKIAHIKTIRMQCFCFKKKFAWPSSF